MAVSTEDNLAIADHMARYCWAVDEGDEDGWIALWTEDGVFAGVLPEPVVGREALRVVVKGNVMAGGGAGMSRHAISNLVCDYAAEDRDTAHAKYYNTVTNWVDGARFTCLAISRVTLVRDGSGWLLKHSQSTLFLG